jgi:hypothetical protein
MDVASSHSYPHGRFLFLALVPRLIIFPVHVRVRASLPSSDVYAESTILGSNQQALELGSAPRCPLLATSRCAQPYGLWLQVAAMSMVLRSSSFTCIAVRPFD